MIKQNVHYVKFIVKLYENHLSKFSIKRLSYPAKLFKYFQILFSISNFTHNKIIRLL